MARIDVASRKRMQGEARKKLANELRKKYEKGASIRVLAAETGRSYGGVHDLLTSVGTVLRGRDGKSRGEEKHAND